jgi:hypothetical protein
MVKTPFHTAFFGPDFGASSWIGMPVYESDFGTGTPLLVAPPPSMLDGICTIIPGREDGTMDVWIGLRSNHMDAFDGIWNKFRSQ